MKHRVSMEVAASKGLPPLKYHLLPRTKGFTTAVQCLRGTGEGRRPETGTAGFPGLCMEWEMQSVTIQTAWVNCRERDTSGRRERIK